MVVLVFSDGTDAACVAVVVEVAEVSLLGSVVRRILRRAAPLRLLIRGAAPRGKEEERENRS